MVNEYSKYKTYEASKIARKEVLEKENGPTFQSGMKLYSVQKKVEFPNGVKKKVKFYLLGNEHKFVYKTYSWANLSNWEEKYMEKNHDKIFYEFFKKYEMQIVSETQINFNLRQKNFTMEAKIVKKFKAKEIAKFDMAQGTVTVYYDEKKEEVYISSDEINAFFNKLKKQTLTGKENLTKFNEKTFVKNGTNKWVCFDDEIFFVKQQNINEKKNIELYDENTNLYQTFNLEHVKQVQIA